MSVGAAGGLEPGEVEHLLGVTRARGFKIARRRRSVGAAVLAATILVVTGFFLVLPPRNSPSPHPGRAPKLHFVAVDALQAAPSDHVPPGYVAIRITEPGQAAVELRSLFARYDIPFTVVAVPVSPDLVGRIIGARLPASEPAGPEVMVIRANCLAAKGPTYCDDPTGLLIPKNFDARWQIRVGRPAGPGESYGTAGSPFAVGGLLHCSSLLGDSVAGAIPILRTLVEMDQVTIYWSTPTNSQQTANPPGTGYIVSGRYSVQPGTIILTTDSSPLTPNSPFYEGYEFFRLGC